MVKPLHEGLGANGCMVEILWHHRETRRQKEKTMEDFALNMRAPDFYPTSTQKI